MDQGGETGGEGDSSFLSPFPLRRVAAGAATTNREPVADEFAATFGEDRRATGKSCALLLASSGGRASEPVAVRSHVTPDCAAAGTNGVADAGQVRIGIVLPRMELGVSEGVVRVGQNRAQFAPSGFGSQIKSVHLR